LLDDRAGMVERLREGRGDELVEGVGVACRRRSPDVVVGFENDAQHLEGLNGTGALTRLAGREVSLPALAREGILERSVETDAAPGRPLDKVPEQKAKTVLVRTSREADVPLDDTSRAQGATDFDDVAHAAPPIAWSITARARSKVLAKAGERSSSSA